MYDIGEKKEKKKKRKGTFIRRISYWQFKIKKEREKNILSTIKNFTVSILQRMFVSKLLNVIQ